MAAYAFGARQVGRLTIAPVYDGEIHTTPENIYGMASERYPIPRGAKGVVTPDWAEHPGFLETDGCIELTVGAFLILGSGDRIVLVDLGQASLPSRFGRGGALMSSLSAWGVEPADVSDIIFTHLHSDHVGWSTIGGRPAFPQATYHCHAHEWQHVYGKNATLTAHLAPIEPQLELWDRDNNLCEGVDLQLATGHTPGSCLVTVSSHGERAVLIGDIVHSAVELIDPDWAGLADADPAAARETRLRIVDELADSGVAIAAAHFPGLRFGLLSKSNRTARCALTWSYC